MFHYLLNSVTSIHVMLIVPALVPVLLKRPPKRVSDCIEQFFRHISERLVKHVPAI